MLLIYTISTVLSFAAGIHCITTMGPEAQVGGVAVHGIRCDHANNNAFLGIPYALPPVGDLRFSSPRPYIYAAAIDATKHPPNCLQFGVANIVHGAQSEDW
jgi:carboxylesterase type B